ncbi:MAG: DUF4080 domain-containing protein, partial [Clostridiales bacterium]|nr:DUF4080 domain-containing protein [Clostridiales bacterium]
LLHGSRLRAESARYGIAYDPDPPYRVRQTDWISEGELDDLALCEDALDKLYNSGRFPETCAYLLRIAQSQEITTPFRLFTEIGRFIGDSHAVPIEEYMGRIMAYGAARLHAEPEALRDCLVMDWLQTNHVGVLPRCLHKPDPINGAIGRSLAHLYSKKDRPPALGTRRAYGYGLLYGGSETQVAIADYRAPKPPLGNYPLRIVSLDECLAPDFT